MKKYLTNSSLETKNLGQKFGKSLRQGDIVLLYGDLGAGKTTLVQGLAKGLNISDRILSPTFVLMRQYEIPHPGPLLKGEGDERRSSRQDGYHTVTRQARTIMLNHIDLYRIENPADIESLGLEEVVNEGDSITVIEWADRLSGFKQKKGYKVWLKHLGKDKREIVINKI